MESRGKKKMVIGLVECALSGERERERGGVKKLFESKRERGEYAQKSQHTHTLVQIISH